MRSTGSISTKKRSGTKAALVVAAGFLAVYFILFYLFQSGGVYEITPQTNNDRFFSMDDSYYINSIYSTKLDDSPRIVKHPVLIAFAHYATLLERAVSGGISLELHYIFVIAGQIILQILALIMLFKILYEHYELKAGQAALLTSIYALSCAAVLYVLIAESYIISGALLISSYWFILKKNPVGAVICGILAGGVTITNIFIWVILMFFYKDSLSKRIRLMAAGGLGLLALIFVLPVRSVFYGQLFSVFYSSPKNYSDVFPLFEALERGFYILFGSTYFYIDTVNESPFGEYPGKAISFIPEAPSPVVVLMAVWAVLILLSVLKGRKNALLLAPAAVLLFNLGLHVIKQYGLKEGFLYSLHHSFAQLLMIACLYRHTENRWIKRAVTVILGVYLCFMVFNNFLGVRELLLLYTL